MRMTKRLTFMFMKNSDLDISVLQKHIIFFSVQMCVVVQLFRMQVFMKPKLEENVNLLRVAGNSFQYFPRLTV